MLRRDMFRAALAATGALIGLRSAGAAADGASKVVYHLSDFDKAAFVLGNIRNHYEGTDGNTMIALVAHGPALAAFKAKGASAIVASHFASLQQPGLASYACANTLQGMDLTLADLLPGFILASRGGVVKLAQMQGDGYAYLRP
jgi:uncharacterized protein